MEITGCCFLEASWSFSFCLNNTSVNVLQYPPEIDSCLAFTAVASDSLNSILKKICMDSNKTKQPKTKTTGHIFSWEFYDKVSVPESIE